MTTKIINIKLIRIDGGTQQRAEINNETVQEYAEAIKAGAEFPPIIVFFDGTDYWVVDGFHRLHGYRTAGKTSINADVRTGTLREAILFSFGVNDKHGMRKTNADKRKAVMGMLGDSEWSAWSDRKIAEACSVTQPFVSGLRKPKVITVITPEAKKPTGDVITVITPEAKKPTGDVITVITPEAKSGANVSTQDAAAEAAHAAAQANAEDAHGDTDLASIVDEQAAEIEALRGQIKAAEADDAKAEAMKYQRIAAIATQRQNELMTRVNEREAELKRYVNTLRRIGSVVGEADPMKVAAAVELFVKNMVPA